MATAPTEVPTFSFLGLRVERKTDLLVATAFLLASITTGYQFWGFMRGARLAVYPPDKIDLFYGQSMGGNSFLRFAGDVTFVNSGQVGQDLVVRDVDATLSLDDKPISRQRWLNSVRLERKDDRPILEPLEGAHPVQVAGGSTVSHTFSFAARPDDCGGSSNCAENFVTESDFTTAFQVATRLALKYEVRSFGGAKAMTAECEVTLTPAYRLALAEDDWVSLPCVEQESN